MSAKHVLGTSNVLHALTAPILILFRSGANPALPFAEHARILAAQAASAPATFKVEPAFPVELHARFAWTTLDALLALRGITR